MARAFKKVKKISEAWDYLAQCNGLDELGPALLLAMRTVVEADVYAVNSFNSKGLCLFAQTWPESAPEADLQVFNAHVREHPSLPAILHPKSYPAVKWSDFTTLRQFRQTGLYHDFFRRTDTNYQLALSVDVDTDTTMCAVLNRRRCDFTEEDRHTLLLMRSQLALAYRHASAQTLLRRTLAMRDACLEGHGTMLVADDGMVIFTNEAAQRLCADFFGEPGSSMIPHPIRAWLDAKTSRKSSWLDATQERRLVVQHVGNVQLPGRVQFLAESPPADFALLLEFRETPEEFSPARLQELDLTPREAEVLLWMAQGKRNTEIALILGASPRTIGKHVENIFAKLGVETRTSAVAAAWEVLRC